MRENRSVILIIDSSRESDSAEKFLDQRQIEHVTLEQDDDPAAARYKCPTLLVWGIAYTGLSEIMHATNHDHNLLSP